MEKALFSITCTTCRRRLSVRSAEAIGAILDCPKCGSFVQVVPPEGWQPESNRPGPIAHQPASQPSKPAAQTVTRDEGLARTKTPRPAETALPSKADPRPVKKAHPVCAVPPAVGSSVPMPVVTSTSALAAAFCPPPDAAASAAPPVSMKPTAAAQATRSPTASSQTKSVQSTAPAASALAVAASATVAAPPLAAVGLASPPPTDPVETMAAGSAAGALPGWATAPFWAKWLLLASAPVVGVGIVLGLWALFSSGRSEPPQVATVEEPAEPTVARATPAEEKPRPLTVPARFDRRWLPDATKLVASIRGSRLAAQPQADKVLGHLDGIWRQSAAQVLRGFGVPLSKVKRLTWASTAMKEWPERCVVVFELEEGQTAGALAEGSLPVDVGATRGAYRRLAGEVWPHPFMVVDDRTIVTGHEELLRGLANRSEPRLESGTMERLLKAVVPEGDVTFLIDLTAARQSGWKLPATLLDVWPAGKRPWHGLWEIPEGLAVGLYWSDALRSELALVCEGESTAERVRTAMDELFPAVRSALPSQAESLKTRLHEGKLNAATADQYKLLLDETLAALQTAQWDSRDGIVWVRMNWGRSPMTAAEAAIDSYPFLLNQWHSAALTVDRANQERLLAGLSGHVKAEGVVPAGAAGGVLLQPETRLSWIAALLPYYGHTDWHRSLEFAYTWNSRQNLKITRQPLPEVVNPVLGPGTSEAGFPVTHYVGVAGMGPDAGRLPASDPRAGVFGYARTTRLEDIADGTSSTIAIMGVTGRCGPWAQGGSATVRPLTQRPYVNGPDGFGSGQREGMLVGMADGSARFLSKDIDPRVLEHMVTIRGGEPVDLASLDRGLPEPKRLAPKPEPALPKPASIAKPAPPREKPAAAKPVLESMENDPRLSLAIPNVELPEMPLSQAVEVVAGIGNVRVAFDLDAMQELGVSLRDPVSIKLAETTVGKALETVASGARLTCVMDRGQLLLTSPLAHRETLRQIRYTVSDLTGDDPRALAGLIAMVERLIVPDSWQSAGGRGSVEAKDGAMVVIQTGSVHYQVLAFCEKLRTARGKPLRSRLKPELFALTTRAARAEPMLGRPITANLGDRPLAEIVEFLKQASGAEIVVDWPALAAAGFKDDVKGTVKAEDSPLGAALVGLLDPLKLACRVADARTLEITTPKALRARLELEFYQVGSLLAKEPPAALMDRIKGRLPEASWSEAGGPGVLNFDPASLCLMVLQTQPVQISLAAVLKE